MLISPIIRPLLRKSGAWEKGWEQLHSEFISGLNRERITLKPVLCPTYVIGAKHDRLRSKEETEDLARLTGTYADYVDGCGHLIPLEKPYELAQLMSTWFNKKGL